MRKNHLILFVLFTVLSTSFLAAQDITQTIRGTVVDKDAQIPLIGANVAILSTPTVLGTSTDLDGEFRIEVIPVGRHTIEVTYLGYEPVRFNSILLTAGKELVLTIEMLESATQMEEVVVNASAQVDKTKPLNEFASVSARTFSVEETSRYAFSVFDPARMAQNYAGVSIGGTGDDLLNEIVIRGNSPSGVLWRLEGIQIPNPNHFGAMGNSGGGISMLSSTTLSNSDFYTGAFPAEFGNALSGVFDLNMRNGNNEKREFSFMLGALGIELATEGPFRKGSKASYLFNYRYSTLSALEAIGLNPAGDILPTYQDVSFKVNVPTEKAGVFGLFGLAGNNNLDDPPERDSTIWQDYFDSFGETETQNVGTIGLSHRILLSGSSYLRTVVAASYERVEYEDFRLDATNDYQRITDYQDDIQNTTFRISSTYNRKINARNTLRAGAIFSHTRFKFYADNRHNDSEELVREFDNQGNSEFVQGFVQLKNRLNESLTLNTGLHYSLMTLNNKMSVEPRASLQWQVSPKHTLSGAVGLHSKMEHAAIYLFEGEFENGTIIQPKRNLGLSKAFHAVLGHDWVLNSNMRLKTELYYQHLYDIPIGTHSESTYSILNATDIWDVIGLPESVPDGTGRNIGIDVTFEKFFSDQYYFLVTGSLFDSRYTPQNGKTYNTRFNGNYQLNLLGGKEFAVKQKKGKQNTFGVNGKFILSGGTRITPIDLDASRMAGYTVYLQDRPFGDRSGVYYRFDLGVSYRINKAKLTHTIMVDIQNVTNRLNVASKYYNSFSENIDVETQTGLFPNFNYRLEF